MYKYLTSAEYLKDYKIFVSFNNGDEGVVDLKDKLKPKGIFRNIMDLQNFKKVKFNPELDTISWPNGADLAPEFLYECLQKN